MAWSYMLGLAFAGAASIQTTKWAKPNLPFHNLAAQPNPHGSYLRKVMKYHFPLFWEDTSRILYENGYNLVEMNEYDDKTTFPTLGHKFDKSVY